MLEGDGCGRTMHLRRSKHRVLGGRALARLGRQRTHFSRKVTDGRLAANVPGSGLGLRRSAGVFSRWTAIVCQRVRGTDSRLGHRNRTNRTHSGGASRRHHDPRFLAGRTADALRRRRLHRPDLGRGATRVGMDNRRTFRQGKPSCRDKNCKNSSRVSTPKRKNCPMSWIN